MIELRPIVFILGILLSVLAVAMVIPAIVDIAVGHPDWQVFLTAAFVTLFVGVSMMLTTRASLGRFSVRQAFVMTNLAWFVIVLFGALPFLFSELELDPVDAFFESMSGVTTTGATVIVGLDFAPPGILLWRAILQWLGGIGIIVMAVAVLPMLQVGGMQLFRVEAFDTDKVLPRAAQIAGGIGIVYVFLTAVGTLALWALGMSGFDAVAHAMTAIATGGFSTYDASVAHFDNAGIDWAISVIMLLGSVPFVLYLRVARGSLRPVFADSQVRWFLSIVGVSVALVALWLYHNELMDPLDALRYSTFNVISVMTGSGFATADYGRWGSFVMAIMFVLMFIGGCAGSTTCGIKIFRLQVLYAIVEAQIYRLMQPNGVFFAYYNRKPIPDPVATSVMSFFFLFAACFALLAIALGLTGLDFVTAVSGAATAIGNVGPGLGDVIGPAGNFASLPDSAKLLLSLGMLLGRLELFTVLILLAPAFWRG
ncbi:MAG TPA: TrkH family potassium uptake protein [Kiloniellaceae bacterium]